MLPLLEILFEDYTATAALRLLRDDLAREATTPLLLASLADRGVTGINLDSLAGGQPSPGTTRDAAEVHVGRGAGEGGAEHRYVRRRAIDYEARS